MSTSAQGQVVDGSGAGVSGVTVVLDDISALLHSTLARSVTDGSGNFTTPNYGEDTHSELGARRVRVSLCVGRHLLSSQDLDEATGSGVWTLPSESLTVDRTDATSQLATLNTHSVSRQTNGNAIRWLVDDFDAWSTLATTIQSTQTKVDIMQLELDVNEFKPNPSDENPAVVLAFGPGLSPSAGRKVDGSDTRAERELLGVAQKPGVSMRIEIPAMSMDSNAIPTGLLLLGGLALLALLSLLLAIILLFVLAVAGFMLNRFLRNAIGNPDAVIAWFTDAGKPDVAKAFPAPMASIIHAKIVTVDDGTAVVLGSPFKQGYYDTQTHDLDERRRGMSAAAEGGPIHDVSARVRGPAVGYLQEVFNLHWNKVDPSANLPVPPPLPPAVSPNAADNEFGASVQVVRTLDSGLFTTFPGGEEGVLEAYLRAIAFAQRFIYIENQYFTDDTIIDAICDALVARSDLEAILVLNLNPDIPFYPRWQRAAVKKIHDALGSTADSRLAAFTTWSHSPPDPPGHTKPRFCPNYIHAKVAIVDNKWATVGSANLDGASLTYFQVMHPLIGNIRNTEANCVVFEDPAPAISAVDAFRRKLWAEHLGIVDGSGQINPQDASLGDSSGKKWIPTWSQTAQTKLTDLASSPTTVNPTHVLAWSLDHTHQDARNYLSHLFAANHLTLPDLDFVEQGPRAFDFQKGNWAR